jgi:hypothetical protein
MPKEGRKEGRKEGKEEGEEKTKKGGDEYGGCEGDIFLSLRWQIYCHISNACVVYVSTYLYTYTHHICVCVCGIEKEILGR